MDLFFLRDSEGDIGEFSYKCLKFKYIYQFHNEFLNDFIITIGGKLIKYRSNTLFSINTPLLRFTYRYIVADFHTLRARKIRRRCKKNKKGLVLFLFPFLPPPYCQDAFIAVHFTVVMVHQESSSHYRLLFG